MVLPQGFRDSPPTFFGHSLTKDLPDWQHLDVTLLQYVDDLLLCGSTETLVSRATESLLNFWPLEATRSQEKMPNYAFLGLYTLA
jgi:hypothetical protein